MADKGDNRNGNGYSPGGFNPDDIEHAEAMKRVRTASSLSISPELFEKLYLSPKTAVKGELRQTFANPTPIALVGFLMALTPLSCDLMGWRGAGGGGAATIGVYFFQGGLLMIIGGILEWVLGNSFASVVFCTFGGFWLSYGATLNPSFAAFSSYAPASSSNSSSNGAEGLTTTGFNASLGFWFLFMGIVCLLFLICALRTNIVFVIIFLSLMTCFFLLTGAYWALAEDYTGNARTATRVLKGAGGCAFVTCLGGWWIFAATLLAIVDFPIQIPVGDLTNVVKGRSARGRAKE